MLICKLKVNILAKYNWRFADKISLINVYDITVKKQRTAYTGSKLHSFGVKQGVFKSLAFLQMSGDVLSTTGKLEGRKEGRMVERKVQTALQTICKALQWWLFLWQMHSIIIFSKFVHKISTQSMVSSNDEIGRLSDNIWKKVLAAMETSLNFLIWQGVSPKVTGEVVNWGRFFNEWVGVKCCCT